MSILTADLPAARARLESAKAQAPRPLERLYASERFRYGHQSAHVDPSCPALRTAHIRLIQPFERDRFKPCARCSR